MEICIIGHFGGSKTFNDGQTVKTLALYEALQSRNIPIVTVDTYYIRKNPFYFVFIFLKNLLRSKKIIVLVSDKGRRVLFPVLAFASRALHKEIYHYAIAGKLADEAAASKQPVSRLNAFKANWVESKALEKRLRALGVTNARYVPNFKNIPVLPPQAQVTQFAEPYRFCTFSRVIKEKGITDAVRAVCSVNGELGRTAATLDIYGPVDPGYQAELDALLAENDCAKYKGVVPANESVQAVCRYYMLLFPTQYKTEGIPGTIIDALSAGVPVIARRWAYCDEMLTNGVDAYVYDFDRPELLREKLLYAVTHPAETTAMRKNCLKEAQKYSADAVVKTILDEMGL